MNAALPRRVMLGIAAVLDVARLARTRPLSAKVLAERHAMAPRQFESLLQDLVRARVLKSSRGPQGGYELARERRRISLGDVARALEGAGPDHPAGEGGGLIGLVVAPAVAEAAAALMARLDEVTIEDLCRRADALERETTGREAADFAI